MKAKVHTFQGTSDGPVAKTPCSCSQCRGPGFNPWSGNLIPHATTKSLQLRKTHHSQIKINICFKSALQPIKVTVWPWFSAHQGPLCKFHGPAGASFRCHPPLCATQVLYLKGCPHAWPYISTPCRVPPGGGSRGVQQVEQSFSKCGPIPEAKPCSDN